jgi:hypothetical protein
MEEMRGWSAYLIVVVWCCAAAARGDIFYSFDPTATSGQNVNVNITPGGTVTLPVYLSFTGADAGLLSTEKGLFSADVHLLRIGAVPSQPTMIGNAAAVQGSALFNEPLGPLVTFNSSGDVDLLQTVNASNSTGVSGDPFGTGSRRVGLGSFTFTGGNLAGQMTVFEALDTPGFNDTVTFASSTVLDSRIGTASVTFNVVTAAAVPVPSAMWGGLALAALLAARRGWGAWGSGAQSCISAQQ